MSNQLIQHYYAKVEKSIRKEHVIDLLQRVCTVSVETMKIVGEMLEE